ncbi:hypothetical protein LA080_002860 [Diaporthe eres]|nr:hypothetical protein LA080_002860 [Diaporthe eres]
MQRPEPSQTCVDSAARCGTLSSDRLAAFLQEPPREGNIGIILPDCTPNIKISRKEKRAAMGEKIKVFTQQHGT